MLNRIHVGLMVCGGVGMTLLCGGPARGQFLLDNGSLSDRVIAIDSTNFPGDYIVRIFQPTILNQTEIVAVGPTGTNSTSFVNPSSSITVLSGQGSDQVRVESLFPGLTISLDIEGQGGDDSITLWDVPSGVAATVNGDGDNDTMQVGSPSDGMDNIQGTVLLDGGFNNGAPEKTLAWQNSTNSLPVGDTVRFLDSAAGGTINYLINLNDLVRPGAATVDWQNMESVELDCSDAGSSVQLPDTGTINTKITGGAATDVITVSDMGLQANVEVLAGGGADEISISKGGIGSFAYADVQGGANPDIITLDSVSPSGADRIQGGSGADQIFVRRTSSSGDTVVDGGIGGDTIEFSSLAGGYSIAGPAWVSGGGGTDTLVVDDSGSTGFNVLYALDASTLVVGTIGSPPTLTYDVEVLDLRLRPADCTMEIAGTHAGQTIITGGPGENFVDLYASAGTTTISLEGEDDRLVVGSTNETLDGIIGDLTIDMGSEDNTVMQTLKSLMLPVGDQLRFEDRLDTSPNGYTLTGVSLVRTGLGTIQFSDAETLVLNAGQADDQIEVFGQSNQRMIIAAGSGADDVQISATAPTGWLQVEGNLGNDDIRIDDALATSATEIDGGDGSDEFELGAAAGNLAGYGGELCLIGGDDSVLPALTVKDRSVPRGDHLLLKDGAQGAANSYTSTFEFVYRNGTQLFDHGEMESMTLFAGTGADDVQLEWGGNQVINLSGGNDTAVAANMAPDKLAALSGQGGSDTLEVIATGTNGLVFLDGGDDSDTFVVGSDPGTLSFEGDVCVSGGAHAATPTVSQNGVTLPVGDRLRIPDQGFQEEDYVMTSTDFTRGDLGLLDYDTVETIELLASSGGTSLEVSTADNTVTLIDGGGSVADDLILSVGAGAIGLVSNVEDVVLNAAGAGSSVQLTGGTGIDRFQVGSTNHGLGVIAGRIAVDGSGDGVTFNTNALIAVASAGSISVDVMNGDTLVVEDSAAIVPQAYSVTDTNIGWGGASLSVAHLDVERVVLRAGSASNDIQVVDAPPAAVTVIHGGPQEDSLSVASLGADSIFVANTGAGVDVVEVFGTGTNSVAFVDSEGDVDSLTVWGSAEVSGVDLSAGDGVDTIYVEGSGVDSLVRTRGDGAGDVIEILNLGAGSNAQADGGGGSDLFRVLACPTNGTVDVNGDAGNDVFEIGSSTNPASTLDAIQGAVSVDGGSNSLTPVLTETVSSKGVTADVSVPVGDTVTWYDGGQVAAPGATTTNEFQTARYRRSSFGVNQYRGNTTFEDVETVEVFAGPGDDHFTLGANGANVRLIANGGDGSNRYVKLNGETNSVTIVRGGSGFDDVSFNNVADDSYYRFEGGDGGDDIIVNSIGHRWGYEFLGGGGADTSRVTSVGDDCVVIMDGEAGADVLKVGALPATSVADLRGGANNDLFEIPTSGLDLSDYPGTLCVDGGDEDATPAVSKQGLTLPEGDRWNIAEFSLSSSESYELTESNLTRVGVGSVDFNGVETIDVSTSTGADQVDVLGAPVGAQTILNLSSGTDTVDVWGANSGSLLTVNDSFDDGVFRVHASEAGSVLFYHGDDGVEQITIRDASNAADVVLGSICIDGDSGLANLDINDQLHADASVYRFTTGGYERVGSWLVEFDNLDTVDLYGGAAANQYVFEAMGRLDPEFSLNHDLTIHAGTAVDEFRIDINTSSNQPVDLVINAGGTGEDSFWVGSAGSGPNWILNGTSGDNTFVFKDGPISPGLDLDMNGLGGNDYFDVVPPRDYFSSSLNVDGGDPVVAPGDVLRVDGAGRSDQTDFGTFIAFGGGTDTGRVFYANIEHVGIFSDDITDFDRVGTNITLTVPGLSTWDIQAEYSTNLTPPQVWLPGSMFTNDFTDGTNILQFDVLDPDQSPFFFRVNFTEP